ncbi:MAG: hypothetical protein ACRD5M_11985 [Candidatus Acidiferrales bacterium]
MCERVFPGRQLPFWIIKQDSRSALREVEFFQWGLNNEHFVEIAEADASRQLFWSLKPSFPVRFLVPPVDGVLLGYEDLSVCGESEKNIKTEDEQNRTIIIWPLLSSGSVVDVNMIDKDAAPNTILLVDFVRRGLRRLGQVVILDKPARK